MLGTMIFENVIIGGARRTVPGIDVFSSVKSVLSLRCIS